ncbi:hypothetical protein EPN28_00115 [Patescibacteria group bacterium]|nr:MAG: hypothetical protein EPN28_00115 [Patescibacteria group bacterium]
MKFVALFAVVSVAACVRPPTPVAATTAAVAIAPKSGCGVVMWKVMHMTEDGDGRPPRYVQVEDPPGCLRDGRPDELDEVSILLSVPSKKESRLEARAASLILIGHNCLPVSIYDKQFPADAAVLSQEGMRLKSFVPKSKTAALLVYLNWGTELGKNDAMVRRAGKIVTHRDYLQNDKVQILWYILGDKDPCVRKNRAQRIQ